MRPVDRPLPIFARRINSPFAVPTINSVLLYCPILTCGRLEAGVPLKPAALALAAEDAAEDAAHDLGADLAADGAAG